MKFKQGDLVRITWNTRVTPHGETWATRVGIVMVIEPPTSSPPERQYAHVWYGPGRVVGLYENEMKKL